VTRDVTFPWWMQVAAVTLQAVGLWRAGSGHRNGWLLATINSAMWSVFALVTAQWLLLASPAVMAVVKLRNWRVVPTTDRPWGVVTDRKGKP
jgi:hypothetical protein